MVKKGRNILEEVEKIPQKKRISVGTVALGRKSNRHHYGARSEQWCVGDIYRLSFVGIGKIFLVLAGLSQLIP
jgi:hypothetical protein